MSSHDAQCVFHRVRHQWVTGDPPCTCRAPVNLSAQVLREVAERIRLRCGSRPGCLECDDDAAIVDRIAATLADRL